jgi:hypothetical protein
MSFGQIVCDLSSIYGLPYDPPLKDPLNKIRPLKGEYIVTSNYITFLYEGTKWICKVDSHSSAYI